MLLITITLLLSHIFAFLFTNLFHLKLVNYTGSPYLWMYEEISLHLNILLPVTSDSGQSSQVKHSAVSEITKVDLEKQYLAQLLY